MWLYKNNIITGSAPALQTVNGTNGNLRMKLVLNVMRYSIVISGYKVKGYKFKGNRPHDDNIIYERVILTNFSIILLTGI